MPKIALKGLYPVLVERLKLESVHKLAEEFGVVPSTLTKYISQRGPTATQIRDAYRARYLVGRLGRYTSNTKIAYDLKVSYLHVPVVKRKWKENMYMETDPLDKFDTPHSEIKRLLGEVPLAVTRAVDELNHGSKLPFTELLDQAFNATLQPLDDVVLHEDILYRRKTKYYPLARYDTCKGYLLQFHKEILVFVEPDKTSYYQLVS